MVFKMTERIVIVRRRGIVARPSRTRAMEGEIDPFIQLCKALRIVSSRDIDDTAARVFKTVLQSARESDEFGSTNLSREAGLNRITVIHHLKRLMDAGIIERGESKYKLKYSSLTDLVRDVRKNTLESLDKLEETARELDENMGIEFPGELDEEEKKRKKHPKSVKIKIE